jgi:hypothetical protein
MKLMAEICKTSTDLKLARSPNSLAAYPCGFAFYVAHPIRSIRRISQILVCWICAIGTEGICGRTCLVLFERVIDVLSVQDRRHENYQKHRHASARGLLDR